MSGRRSSHAQVVWLDVTENIKLRDDSGVWSLSMQDLRKALQQIVDPRRYEIQLPDSRRVSSNSKADIILLAPRLERSRLEISEGWRGRIYPWKDFLDRNKVHTSDVLKRIKKNGERENRHGHRRHGGDRHDKRDVSRSGGDSSSSQIMSGSRSSRSIDSSSGSSGSVTNSKSQTASKSASVSMSQTVPSSNHRHRHASRKHHDRHRSNGRRNSRSGGGGHGTSRRSDKGRSSHRSSSSRTPTSPYNIKVTNLTPFRVHLTLYELRVNADQSSFSGSVLDRLALFPSRDRKGQDQGVLRREPQYQLLTQAQCIIVTFRAVESSHKSRSRAPEMPPPMVLNFWSQSKDMDLAIQDNRIINYSIQSHMVQPQQVVQTAGSSVATTQATVTATQQQQPSMHQPKAW